MEFELKLLRYLQFYFPRPEGITWAELSYTRYVKAKQETMFVKLCYKLHTFRGLTLYLIGTLPIFSIFCFFSFVRKEIKSWSRYSTHGLDILFMIVVMRTITTCDTCINVYK